MYKKIEPVELSARNKNRVRPRYVKQDVVDENGQVVRKMVLELHDYAVPFTPQRGIECQATDLNFIAKRGLRVEHEKCYLSNLGRNPIALQRLRDTAEKNFKELENKYNNDTDKK